MIVARVARALVSVRGPGYRRGSRNRFRIVSVGGSEVCSRLATGEVEMTEENVSDESRKAR